MRNRFNYYMSNGEEAWKVYETLGKELEEDVKWLKENSEEATADDKLEIMKKLYWHTAVEYKIYDGCKNEAAFRRQYMKKVKTLKKEDYNADGWILRDGTIVNIDPFAKEDVVTTEIVGDYEDLRHYFEPGSQEFFDKDKAFEKFLEEGNIYFNDFSLWVETTVMITKNQTKKINKLIRKLRSENMETLSEDSDVVFILRLYDKATDNLLNLTYGRECFLNANVVEDIRHTQKNAHMAWMPKEIV